VRALLQNLVDEHAKRAAHKGLVLKVEVAAGVPARLIAHPGRISAILEQLIDNAIKFSEAGVITLEADLAGQAAADPTVRLLVRDQGMGIAGDKLPGLFDAFVMGDESATRERGGAGLGLTLASSLAAREGAQLGADSTPGQGSSFWLNLPLRLPEADMDSGRPAVEPHPQSGHSPGTAGMPRLSAAQIWQLQRMQALLEEGNTHCLSEWHSVKPLLASWPGDEIGPLDEAIEHYAFKDAASLLRPMLAQQLREKKTP
jgi:hypothetical protein